MFIPLGARTPSDGQTDRRTDKTLKCGLIKRLHNHRQDCQALLKAKYSIMHKKPMWPWPLTYDLDVQGSGQGTCSYKLSAVVHELLC